MLHDSPRAMVQPAQQAPHAERVIQAHEDQSHIGRRAARWIEGIRKGEKVGSDQRTTRRGESSFAHVSERRREALEGEMLEIAAQVT